MYKIGVLSAGSQSSISIIKSLKKLKIKYKIQIYAFDIDKYSAGLYLADGYKIIKKINSRGYFSTLLNIIKSFDLDFLIPQLDSEIKYLLKYKNKIEKKTKCKLIINDNFTCNISLNKLKANNFCIKNNINVPKIINPNSKVENRTIIFRRFMGIGSRGLKIYTKNEFNKLSKSEIKQYLKTGFFQIFQLGQEYTIDIVNKNYVPQYIVPRKRVKVVDGQITKGEIVLDQKLINFAKKIIKIFKIKGHACLQCIVHKGKIYFIELNPRFGTGMSLSELGGADLTEFILNNKLKPLNYKVKKVKFSRYWGEVRLR